MDIGKGMNFSKFRKSLAGLFSGMWGFWIYVGTAFLLLLILFFVFIFPLSNHYAKTCKDLDDLTTPLENYALKAKNIYNDKWITSKKLEANYFPPRRRRFAILGLGSDIPTWDAISPVQKKFWILEALVNVALNNAGITKLEKIAFRESSFT